MILACRRPRPLMMSSSRALLAASVNAPPSCSGSSSATTICAGRGPAFHRGAYASSDREMLACCFWHHFESHCIQQCT